MKIDLKRVYFLQATEPRRSRKYPDLHQLEVELETAREEKIRAKKKRKLEAATTVPDIKKAKVDPATNQKRKGRARRKDDDSDDNDEEQEDCSAKPKCLKPVGKEVSATKYLVLSKFLT